MKSAKVVFKMNVQAEIAQIESDEVEAAIVLKKGDTAIIARKINIDDFSLVFPVGGR